MADKELFESYGRRIPQITATLKKYGMSTVQDAQKVCADKGIDPAAAAPISMQEYRTQQLDLLADGVRHNLDLAAVYAAMGLAQPAERGNDQ